jgi:hypothetical protein
MMQNQVHALRASFQGKEVLMPAEYSDQDDLTCVTPLGDVSVEPHADSEAQFAELLKRIRDLGLTPWGCFDCKFFTQSGMQQEAGGLGYCLEGKLGSHVNSRDYAHVESSCDAYAHGDAAERSSVRDRWFASLPRWRGDRDLRDLMGKRAAAWFNGDFISVESYAFHARAGFDPQGARHFLPPDAVDEWLGEAVLNALHCSRFLSLDEARVFFDLRRVEPAYAAWTESFMKRYGYKSKRLLF